MICECFTQYFIKFVDMLEAMCEEQASNVTRLVDLLKMSGVPEKLKQVGNQSNLLKQPTWQIL